MTIAKPGGSYWPAKSAHPTYPLSLHNGAKFEVPDLIVRPLSGVRIDEVPLGGSSD